MPLQLYNGLEIRADKFKQIRTIKRIKTNEPQERGKEIREDRVGQAITSSSYGRVKDEPWQRTRAYRVGEKAVEKGLSPPLPFTNCGGN